MKRLVGLLFLVLAGVFLANAATLTVPGQYSTITAALAAARPGDEIVVTSSYTGAGETFPIFIQIDNLTLRAADVGVTIKDLVVVGAKRVFDPASGEYKPVRVSGVRVLGFNVKGVVIKEADEVIVAGNNVGSGGIRLIDAHRSAIAGNMVTGAEIGIFLERSDNNNLSENDVYNCDLGLFIFESSGNIVTGDTYEDNDEGGVVLNDSQENVLQGLTVTENGGWGVRFVFADNNTLQQSWIADNAWGGIELLGSVGNLIEGNVVYNNGKANDGSDDAQIVVTFGDKAIFTTDVFAEYPGQSFEEFVDLKHDALGYIMFLLDWVQDLDRELVELRQKLATAWGMTQPPRANPDQLKQFIEGPILWEKHYIASDVAQTPSGVFGVLIREFWEDSQAHRPAMMGNPATNFTLPEVPPFLPARQDRDTLDRYHNGTVDDFGLNRNGGDGSANTDDDEISWDKLAIMRILVQVVRHHLKNGFTQVTSLWDILEELLERGLITQKDCDDLRAKINAAIGFTGQMEEVLEDIRSRLNEADEFLEHALDELENEVPDWDGIADDLLEAKNRVEQAIQRKYEIYILVWDIWYKLCLVDLELPRFPEVNSTLVGKKEKPFEAINDGDIGAMKAAIVAKLNADPQAVIIRNAVAGQPLSTSDPWRVNDIQVNHVGLRASERNVISSNVITSDLVNSDRNIGIVIECPHNAIVNNLITNEAVKPIDSEPRYGEFHRLDVAIVLLADECLIAYNAIEWVNNGIIRGGTWKRKDIQMEYVFSKLVEAAYWPEPGWPEPGNPDNDRLCCTNPWTGQQTCYTADHFEQRTVAWFPTLSVSSTKVDVGFATSQYIKRNRISLNFFEHCGVSIHIIAAESNTIDENLFYMCANGMLFYKPGKHPWYTDDLDIQGAGPNIQLLHNDYFGGIAIHNESNYAVNASSDYTPPSGPGHAVVIGNVNPPSAGAPWAYENFLDAKFLELAGWALARMGLALDMVRFKWDGLPPNLAFFFPGVVLPEQKPRHPDDIFEVPQPLCLSALVTPSAAHWAMVSIPVYALDPAKAAVFGDDVPFLYIWKWNGVGYESPATVEPTGGYWLFLMEPTTLDVCGIAPDDDVEFTLPWAGWHMISVPTIAVYWGYVQFRVGTETKPLPQAVAAGWVLPYCWEYNVSTGTYTTTNILQPWVGYWIKTLVPNVTVILPIEFMLTNPPMPPTSVELLGGAPQEMPPAPPSLAALAKDMLTVMSYPNPATTSMVTFRALGLPVEGIRVSVFDLGGRKVWAGEAVGPELAWNLADSSGRPLANGVYLYVVEAQLGGQWVSTGLQRLLILR